MMMLPGSHRGGRREHRRGTDGTNVLDNDQTSTRSTTPTPCCARCGPERPRSTMDQSGDRRIGLNIQYLSPSVRQTLHDQ